jgi:hypothetical protein
VRSTQTVWLTDDEVAKLETTTGMPTATCDNSCHDIDLHRCEQLLCGEWKLVPGSPEVCMMHATLVPEQSKMMFFGYGDTRDDLSRVWDYAADPGVYSLPGNQPFDVTQPPNNRPLANIWSAEHTYLADPAGTLLVHGGFAPRETYLFDPGSLTWSRKSPTAADRFYSTTLTLADGRVLTLFGSASKSLEVYDPGAGAWAGPMNVPPGTAHHEYHPWAYLLPGGKIFIAGPHMPTQRFDWSPTGITNLESFPTIARERSTGGEKGTSVLLPLRPPGYEPRALVAGGGATDRRVDRPLGSDAGVAGSAQPRRGAAPAGQLRAAARRARTDRWRRRRRRRRPGGDLRPATPAPAGNCARR